MVRRFQGMCKMDPTATFEFLTDTGNRPSERAEALQDLAAWIARGGIVPDTCGYVPDDVWEIEEGDCRELISAVNVVLANGDLSGLEGLGFSVIR